MTGFVLSLSWLSSVTTGHTKRVIMNAVMLSVNCIRNAAGPFMWQAQYLPRYALAHSNVINDNWISSTKESRSMDCYRHLLCELHDVAAEHPVAPVKGEQETRT